MKKLIILFLILLLIGCGGSSGGGYEFAIDGTWQGEETAGVLICDNGVSTGIGAGSVVRQVIFEITGSDEIGSEVDVIDGECMLIGKRTIGGFKVQPVSGCDEDLISVIFTLSAENQALVSFNHNNEGLVLPAGQPHCQISDDGTLSR